ncbi:CD47 protein, partial [Eurystomus gularis]|nr:CD47 protein [Eurystomus gularis]
GSAQLIFTATDVVERTACNETVILPCHVTNLQEQNAKVMFVIWKTQNEIIFSFDGARDERYINPKVPSANLVAPMDLPKGNASLILKSAEAKDGNYSCEVTESNREGETRVELRNRSGSWFHLVERAIIIALLFLVIILCSAQLIAIASKYEMVPEKKIGLILSVCIFTIAAVIGTVLFVQDGYTAQNQAGLGLIVIPAVSLVPLQYLMFGIVFDSLPQAAFALIGLHILGYVIAVVGFALCVSACPPVHGPVVIAGLAIMVIANLLSLAYVFII